MHFTVRHETLYRYSAPVRLGDQLLRLKPFGVRTLDHRYEISPAPAWQEERISPHGTPETRVGFLGETRELRIVSRFTCESIAPPAPETLPPLPWDMPDMATCLGTGEENLIIEFAQQLLRDSGAPLPFLHHLTETLYARTRRHIRPTGYAQTPSETLSSGAGACRDLAVLFIATCRSLGIPARFVSGYQARAETPDGKRHLHAWPEVYLPGLGWQGFDPTHGVAVTDGHVGLAAAPDQIGTMPIEGGFWGDGVTSELSFGVEIGVE
jgi:Transglutaminase-like enzymes, putative cysteine proteases